MESAIYKKDNGNISVIRDVNIDECKQNKTKKYMCR